MFLIFFLLFFSFSSVGNEGIESISIITYPAILLGESFLIFLFEGKEKDLQSDCKDKYRTGKCLSEEKRWDSLLLCSHKLIFTEERILEIA